MKKMYRVPELKVYGTVSQMTAGLPHKVPGDPGDGDYMGTTTFKTVDGSLMHPM